MNALQAGLRGECPDRLKSDFLSAQMRASVVHFFYSLLVFIGRIGPLFLAAVRQAVYHCSPAFSTRQLIIQYIPLDECAGLVGGSMLAMQVSLKPRRSVR